MVEYKECYVAFIDILGFKNLIDDSECEDIYNIFQSILDFEPHPLISNASVYKHIHHTIMSDSIVVYIEAAITDGFISLADVCSQIQMRLSRNHPPIFVRGGIAKGSLYHQNNILFGTGLTKAYILESTAAIYPRIIFSNEVRENALENTKNFYMFDYDSSYYKKDNDEWYYINFLNTFNSLKTWRPRSVEESIEMNNMYFDSLLSHVNEVLGKETDNSIRRKYLWLKGKLTEEIEHMPQVKKYFEDLSNKKHEEEEKRCGEAIISASIEKMDNSQQ